MAGNISGQMKEDLFSKILNNLTEPWKCCIHQVPQCSAKGLNWKIIALKRKIHRFDCMVMANTASVSKYSNLVEVITSLAKNWKHILDILPLLLSKICFQKWPGVRFYFLLSRIKAKKPITRQGKRVKCPKCVFSLFFA